MRHRFRFACERRTIPSVVGWTMLYLFVFLKLPIVAACYIIWWAVHQTTDTDDATIDGGGSPRPRRPHPRPRRPRPPRRGGPACGARLAAPRPRIRSVTAAGRARELHQ
jgi:hypothetical protein